MKQGLLPFWNSEELLTYSEIEVIRAEKYASQGPALLRRVSKELKSFADDDPEALSNLNRLSTTLGALNPAWTEFSTEVLRATLTSPTQRVADGLLGSFQATLERLAA